MRTGSTLFLILLTTFSLIGFFRYLVMKGALKGKGFMDVPGGRSSHDTPTPRGGGVIFIGIWCLIALIYALNGQWKWAEFKILVPPCLVIAAIGFVDDRQSISAKLRFFVHLIAAVSTVLMIGSFKALIVGEQAVYLGFFGTLFAILAITWSTNLFNFMDGADGIAATEAIFLFGFGGVCIWFAGSGILAVVTWALVATVTSFLFWNWPRPKAKIFMGDGGSGALGFLAAAIAFMGEAFYKVPMLVWLILYSPFFYDTTLTLIRRMIRWDKWWYPHRMHAFQRLLQSGWSHQKLLLGFVALNIPLTTLALFVNFNRRYIPFGLAGAFLFLTVIYMMIERKVPMYSNHQTGVKHE